MFVGFFFGLILLPLTLILLVVWALTQRAAWGKALGSIWLSVIVLVAVAWLARPLWQKKVLARDDYYGEYVIDRRFFPGRQSDWQYRRFHFVITPHDSIYFYETPADSPARVVRGYISTVAPSGSARLRLHLPKPTHHVLATNPTIYRGIWTFVLVFNSPKFGNLFFTKGQWEPKAD